MLQQLVAHVFPSPLAPYDLHRIVRLPFPGLLPHLQPRGESRVGAVAWGLWPALGFPLPLMGKSRQSLCLQPTPRDELICFVL